MKTKQYYRANKYSDVAMNKINMATNEIMELEERLINRRAAKKLENNRFEFQNTLV